MASIINEIVPVQGFEIVLNRLGVILLEEITNQKILDPLISDFSVFIERQENYSQSEDVVISVSCNNINYGAFDPKETQGDASYFVDVYCGGSASESETGNDNARLKIHKFAGMIRYILSSAKYLTLGFPMGVIGGKYLKSIEFQDGFDSSDGSFIRHSRLTLNVRIQESQQAWLGIALNGNDTEIHLSETDKGYQLILNN